jgi:uncharacterized protein DUF4253
VRKFIDAGANPNADAPIGTPLDVAASWPRSRKPAADDSTLTQIVRMLLDAGADVNFAGACGTPLSGAVLENNTGPALALIAAGADLRPASPLDDPLLIQAIRHRNAQIARALIEAGADVNEPARNGMSPAALAQKLKRDEILAMIQGRSAKPVPRKGQTLATPAKPKTKATAAAKAPEPIKGSPAFRQAVAELEGLCGAKAFPLEGTAGFTVHVDSRSGFDLDKAFKEFQKRGFLLFAADMDASRVVILPTADKYVAVEAMGTNGANYGLSPEDVIRWLRDLEKTHPFELTGIGFDFLKGRFTQPVSKPAALAKQMAEFCPGDDYEPAFARDLKKGRRFTFWWD